jgi:beta-lactamase class D
VPRLLLALCLLAIPLAARAETVCTAFADAASGAVLMQEGDCAGRAPPASTFKVAIAVMGYDAGILVDAHTPALPFREGYPDWIESWRQTTDPTSWMTNSVLWYSQQVTQALGIDRFRAYLSAFDYGNADASAPDGLTRSWLSSTLAISPLEQIAFLRHLVRGELPVSAHAREMTVRLTALGMVGDGWALHGKTGTGYPVLADGTADRSRYCGWFVGWATKDDRTVLFARLTVEPRGLSGGAGPRTRAALVEELPALLDNL